MAGYFLSPDSPKIANVAPAIQTRVGVEYLAIQSCRRHADAVFIPYYRGHIANDHDMAAAVSSHNGRN